MYDSYLNEKVACGEYTEESRPQLILTIDGSQGQEIPFAILDTVIGELSDGGFFLAQRRQTVAFSRAQHVLWILSGLMKQAPSGKIDSKKPKDMGDITAANKKSDHMKRYKEALVKMDCYHRVPAAICTTPGAKNIPRDLRDS